MLGSKSSVLTIKTAKLALLSDTSVFKCKLKSALYPIDSPDVVNDMTLTLLTLGKTFFVFHHGFKICSTLFYTFFTNINLGFLLFCNLHIF